MLRAEALNQLALVRVFDQSFPEAADLLRLALSQTDDDLNLQVRTLVALSWALVNAGHLGEAVDTVEDAVGRATRLGQPDLLSQALCLRVVMHFMRGEAIDEPEPATSPRIGGQPHQHSCAVPAEHAERHDARLDRAVGPGAR